MATILDLFRNSDKDINHGSPDRTPISEGLGIDGSKNIDSSGEYYTNEYKYGTNYSKKVDTQKGKDKTPMSEGRGEDGSKSIDSSGTYFTNSYRYGTNYSTKVDTQKGKDKTPISDGSDEGGSKNIDVSGIYFTNPYRYGTNYSTDVDKQKGKDKTPMSDGDGEGGSKDIDKKGTYYTNEYKYGTNYSTDVDKQMGKDKTPMSDGKGMDGSKNIDAKGPYFTNPYIYGVNYSTDVDKQKGKDKTPISEGDGIDGSKNINPEGIYFTNPYIFGTNYSTDVDKQKGKDKTPISAGDGIDGTKNIDEKGIYYTDQYKYSVNYSKDVDKQKGKDKTPISDGTGIEGTKNIDQKGIYYTNTYKYGVNYSTDVDKQKGKDITPYSLQAGNTMTSGGKAGNIDLNGLYYSDNWKYGINYRLRAGTKFKNGLGVLVSPYLDPNLVVTPPGTPGGTGPRDGTDLEPRLRGLIDQTPFSLGTDEFGSKNIDRGGQYYNKLAYRYGIYYPEAIDKQINNEDIFQFQIGKKQVDLGGVRNGALKIAKILPKKAFTRVKTVLDQEMSGLRVKHLTSVIDIYGTDLIRITKQRTDLVEKMKKATPQEETIKNLISKVRNFKETVKKKIGNFLGIPRDLIPTTVIEIGKELVHFRGTLLSSENGPGNEQDTMEYLAKIKEKAEGSIIGKFLAKNTGTPKQIVKSAVSGVGKGIKKKVRGALFGRGTTIGVNEPKVNSMQKVIYGSSLLFNYQRYTKIMEEEIQKDATVSPLLDRPSDIDGVNRNWLNKKFENPDPYSLVPPNLDYYRFNTQRKNDRNIDYLRDHDRIDSEPHKIINGSVQPDPLNNRGYKIKINPQLFKIGDDLSTKNKYIDNVIIQIGDVRFHNVAISGLSETFSPSWSSYRMVGSPFSAYTYDSIDRSVSFTIKLYALNPKQHKENWDNIQKINKLVYPLSYVGKAGAVTPPVTKITLGDMYIDKHGFIESLSYSIDDDSTWELGRGKDEINEYKILFENEHYKDGQYIQLGSQLSDVPNRWNKVNELFEVVKYRAPRMIEMQITFRFIEYKANGSYGFVSGSAGFIPLTPPTPAPRVFERDSFGIPQVPRGLPSPNVPLIPNPGNNFA